MKSTKIEWTDTTLNPVTGCNKISEGCLNCYAARMAKRLKLMGQAKYKNGFEVTLHREVFSEVAKIKKPSKIFVNSMSDIFHVDVPLEFIEETFEVIKDNPKHTFQLLTKRSERLLQLNDQLQWPENLWMGTSVESAKYQNRVDDLMATAAKVKFLSIEPLIGPIGKIDLTGIHWAIAGGESGPGARPMNPDWVREVRDQCIEQKVPFFFKQWGGVRKDKTGRILDGREWLEYPSTISI